MRRFSLLVLAVLVAACGSKPIPLVAQAGTTFALLVPNDLLPGYGRAFTSTGLQYHTNNIVQVAGPAYDPSSPLEDEQRGELFVVGWPDVGTPTRMPVRYISRIAADPLSPVGLGLQSVVLSTQGQAIAFIDIPTSTGAGDYNLRFYVNRRYPGTNTNLWLLLDEPGNYALLPGRGAGWDRDSPSEPLDAVRITITAGTVDNFTPIAGGDGGDWKVDLKPQLNGMVPFPSVRVGLPAVPIGAAELAVTYPSNVAEIKGIAVERVSPSEAFASHTVVEATGTECDDLGTVSILLADPAARTTGIRVAFKLKDFDGPCGRALDSTDFQVASEALFNLEGVPIAGGAGIGSIR